MNALFAGVLVMMIEFNVLHDRRDDFVAVTARQVEVARSFDGNIQFDVLVDDARPNVVVYIERWRSAKQQSAFFAWWQAQGLSERLRPYVVDPPRITVYRQAVD